MSNRDLPLYAYFLCGAAAVLGVVTSLPYHGIAEFLGKLAQWSITIALGIAIVFAYLIPWRVARRRNHPNTPAILVLTILLGWTLIGWAIALIWAMTAYNQKAPS